MRRFAFDRGLAGAAVLLALAAPARSQDEGVKQVEQLVKKAGATVEAIAGARAQLVKTMDVYNGLMVNEVTTDRKGAYKKLQQEMATTDKRRADIRTRADEMKVEADALFKSWGDSTAAIADPALRKRSEDRLARTKASCAEIGNVAQRAADLYAPVMTALQDQVTYLGHDLNASSVASLKGDAAKLNDQSKELLKRIDETIATANTTIGGLRPQ
jgi:hypothetical protein